jgi:hypothetical protein
MTSLTNDGLVVMVNNPEEYSMVPSFPGGPKIKYVGLNDFRLNYFNVGDEFLFRYDFGDGWEIKLKIEKLDDQNELSAKNLPRIIAGKGFGIVENVGGVDVLKEFGRSDRYTATTNIPISWLITMTSCQRSSRLMMPSTLLTSLTKRRKNTVNTISSTMPGTMRQII